MDPRLRGDDTESVEAPSSLSCPRRGAARSGAKASSRRVAQLPHHLGERAGEGMEGEAHEVPPARADHGAKEHVGLEDLGVGTVNVRLAYAANHVSRGSRGAKGSPNPP